MAKPASKPAEKPGPPKGPKLHMPEDLESIYANMVRIAHTPSELVFDFSRFLPGDPHASIVSRVLMSPLGAKLLLTALSDNLSRYEATFGEIIIPKKQSLADTLFKAPPETDDTKGD